MLFEVVHDTGKSFLLWTELPRAIHIPNSKILDKIMTLEVVDNDK